MAKKSPKPFILGVCDCCERGGLMFNTQDVHWCLDCLKESLGWFQLDERGRKSLVNAHAALLADPRIAKAAAGYEAIHADDRKREGVNRAMRRLMESTFRGEQ